MNTSSNGQQKRVQRSRGGCATCKAKKWKCDEQRPECLMCVKKGYTCPGYKQPLRWSTKHEHHSRAIGIPSRSDSAKESQTSPATGDETAAQSNSPHGYGVVGNDSCLTAELDDSNPGNWSSTTDLFLWGEHEAQVAATFEGGSNQNGSMDLFGTPGLSDLPTLPSVGGSDELDLDGFSVPIACHTAAATDLASSTTERINNSESDSNGSIFPSSSGNHISQITDLPSFLITTWFTYICPMWSAFDSDTNMNRKIALECCTSNESVFYSLQSMAALYILDRLPHLSSVARLSGKRAVQAVKLDLSANMTSRNVEKVPAGLALSLICLGTSMCWSDPKQLGLAFLRETKALLQRFNRVSISLQPEERRRLAFLNNSCFYWDMLCRAVDNDEKIGPTWQLDEGAGDWNTQLEPHPWTGVAATTQRFFASAVSVCRRFHAREKRPHKITGSSLRASLQDIEEATSLEQQIRNFHISVPHNSVNTGDVFTPGAHLTAVAEAYRLAAILQLYATFDDLATPTRDSQPECNADSNTREPNESKLLSVAFKLLHTLESIPPNSGSRSIQPILYITASIGLRFNEAAESAMIESDPFTELQPMENPALQSSISSPTTLTDTAQLCSYDTLKNDVNIGRSRYFVMSRLDILERSLPSRPIKVAKSLIKEIWASYDSFPNETHWLDVMQRTGLYTIFG